MAALVGDDGVLGGVDHGGVVDLREGVARELELADERAPDGLDLLLKMLTRRRKSRAWGQRA